MNGQPVNYLMFLSTGICQWL